MTFDIYATQGAYALGTHSIVVDGLTPGEVLAGLAVLPEFDNAEAF